MSMLLLSLVAASASAQTELVFAADWSESVTGPLIEGDTVRVVYDASRLTDCRGERYGREAWAINASVRFASGVVRTFPVALPADQAAPPATLLLEEGGPIEVWFVNSDAWGCVAYDSDFGANYRYQVAPEVGEPAWMGDAVSVVSRATCANGGPCWSEGVPLAEGVVYDSWARQRATVAVVAFDVWEPGVTDFDNPDLWQQLDARIHWRADPREPYAEAPIDLYGFYGDNARFSHNLRDLDPFPMFMNGPDDCPDFPVRLSPDRFHLQARVQVYFTVNGAELRPAPGKAFNILYEDDVTRYRDICRP